MSSDLSKNEQQRQTIREFRQSTNLRNQRQVEAKEVRDQAQHATQKVYQHAKDELERIINNVETNEKNVRSVLISANLQKVADYKSTNVVYGSNTENPRVELERSRRIVHENKEAIDQLVAQLQKLRLKEKLRPFLVFLGIVIGGMLLLAGFIVFSFLRYYLQDLFPEATAAVQPLVVLTTTPKEKSVTSTIDESSGDNLIFSDNFSSPNWGTGTDTDSSVEYANGGLQMTVYTKKWFVWSTPNDQDYENIHMEVDVINNDTDPGTAFGLMCNQQATDGNYYYFAITPAGQYAIAKANEGQNDVILTNNGEWASSKLIPKDSSNYRVSVDCANGQLVLYVAGQQIASAADSSYEDGSVGLFLWSSEQAATTSVSFDDFAITKLE
jgi:hypothetical protein